MGDRLAQEALDEHVDRLVERGGEQQALAGCGVWSSRRRTAGRKPRSAMWSASSRTVTSIEPRSQWPCSIRSSRRPGQATTMSTPLRRPVTCGFWPTPPKTVWVVRPAVAASGWRASSIWPTSSRVGARISARGAWRRGPCAAAKAGDEREQEGEGLAGAGAAAAEDVAAGEGVGERGGLDRGGGGDAARRRGRRTSAEGTPRAAKASWRGGSVVGRSRRESRGFPVGVSPTRRRRAAGRQLGAASPPAEGGGPALRRHLRGPRQDWAGRCPNLGRRRYDGNRPAGPRIVTARDLATGQAVLEVLDGVLGLLACILDVGRALMRLALGLHVSSSVALPVASLILPLSSSALLLALSLETHRATSGRASPHR